MTFGLHLQVKPELLTADERPLIILEGVKPYNNSAEYPEFTNWKEMEGCFVYEHEEGADWKEGLTAFFKSVSTNAKKPSGFLTPEERAAKQKDEAAKAAAEEAAGGELPAVGPDGELIGGTPSDDRLPPLPEMEDGPD